MKFINSLLLLVVPAMAMAAEESRDLQQIADWHVTITSVTAQAIEFHTGAGGGTLPHIEVHLTDKCRLESATRIDVGSFFPTSNVQGIDVADAGIVANPGGTELAPNSFNWKFVEGINGNTNIYSDDGNGQTATVTFCILIGIYESDILIDYAESKMVYSINLITQIPELTGYTVTQAEQFDYDGQQAIEFDGQLEAYFCNSETYAKLENDNNNAKTNQGSILHVCFKVVGGQFEVDDIMSFTVSELDTETGLPRVGGPAQDIIVNSDSASALYSTKACVDDTTSDKNICVVSFLLRAAFYDTNAITLTGEGDVLLEFGTSETGARRRLRRKLQADPVQEHVQVEPQAFEVEKLPGAAGSSASALTSFAAVGAIAGAALVL